MDRVELDVAKQRVDMFAKHDTPKSRPCDECGRNEARATFLSGRAERKQ